MLICPRRAGDLAACAGLVRETHAVDGYPRVLPEDLGSFLDPPGAYGCWVAWHGGAVAGHVVLLPRGAPSVLELASQVLGRPADRLAVVSRLLVGPRARGRGAGGLLLETATAEAHARGRQPVLDVDADLAPAIGLYERSGWVRAGTVTVGLGGGRVLEEYVYLGPAPAGI